MVIHVGLGFLLNNQKQNLETLCESWQRSLFYGKSMAVRLIERIEARQILCAIQIIAMAWFNSRGSRKTSHHLLHRRHRNIFATPLDP